MQLVLSQHSADRASFAVISSTIKSLLVAFDLNDYLKPVSSFYSFPNKNVLTGFTMASAGLENDGATEIVVAMARHPATVWGLPLNGQLKKAFHVNMGSEMLPKITIMMGFSSFWPLQVRVQVREYAALFRHANVAI